MDTNPSLMSPNAYSVAKNVTLTEDGKYWALSNFRGTTFLGSLTGTISTIDDCTVRLVPSKYKIGTRENVNCITAFMVTREGSSGALYITCYDLDTNTLFYLYQQRGLDSTYFGVDRLVDARNYPENGIDYIYFEDDFNEGRQLRCEIPTGATDFFLTQFDLSLQRWGANGAVTFFELGTGTVVSGTYQFSYRLVDPTKKRFTKWSSLSKPFHVYNRVNDNDLVYSSIGLPTAFSIKGFVSPTPEEVDRFVYYQLAVVENIYGINTPVQSASLQPIKNLTSANTAFEYKTNDNIGTVPISDITIPVAAIKSAKTLAIKQNRLFKGNIVYRDLTFDKGTPAIGSGNVEVATVVAAQQDLYSDGYYSTTLKGYFRDEVYRIGIVYKDKYGNDFPVKILDLSGVTGNIITSPLTDIRFPGRTYSNTYSLLDSGSNIRVIGLTLGDIHNHPTEAVSFEIVRAKRIKKILFQTPVIPMTFVEGIGAFDKYPSQSRTGPAATPGTTDFTSVTPQSTARINTPKNLFWPEMRNIHRRDTTQGATNQLAKIGEANLSKIDKDGGSYNPRFTYAMIFPPSSMFGDTPYTFTNAEKLQTIDLVLTKATITDFDSGATYNTGDYINTRVSGTFHALTDSSYYFNSSWSGKTVAFSPVPAITDYSFLDNLSTGTTLAGGRIAQFSELSGTGINWGYEEKVSKAAYVQMSTPLSDLSAPAATTVDGNASPFAFGAGTLNFVVDGGYVVGASGPQYEFDTGITNKYLNKYAGFVSGTSFSGGLRIVNVINDYGDDRYGDNDTQHEFISTGASYSFTESELVNVRAGNTVNIDLTVFGGDCFITSHTFKVADTWYSVVNQPKNFVPSANDSIADLLAKWDGRYYENTATAAISLPVALQGASQFVQIILESEYNAGVLGSDIAKSLGAINGFPITGLSTTANKYNDIRVPLTYNYNINLSKQNDQRVYFVKPAFSFLQNDYKARIVYSDQKIYGSDTQGFDIIRVGNTYDIEESRGGITKLTIESDQLYAIQERGIVNLPVGQTQLETTDAALLAVGTGDVIGRHIVIDQKKGSQNIGTIVETGDAVYITDVLNSSQYRLSNSEIKEIQQIGVKSTFHFSYANPPEFVSFFDNVKNEFWLIDNHASGSIPWCYVFSETVGKWIANFDTKNGSTSKCVAGVSDDRFYLANFTSHNVRLNTMYTGNYSTFFGTTVTPFVSFYINPESDLSKTFDNQVYQATEKLAQVSFTTSSPTIQTGVRSLDIDPVQAHYKIKIPRDDQNTKRFRGTHLINTVFWKTTNTQVTLSSVLTKYRLSARTPF